MTARRDFLAFTAGAVAARTVLPIAAQAAPATADTTLLTLPGRHVAAKLAYNAYDGPEDAPAETELWDAYRATIDTALNTPATTLSELIAKAQVADAQMRSTWLDGHVSAPNDTTEELLRSIMDDLLRLAGGGA